METDGEAVRTKVRERYSIAATGRGFCQDDACCASGYSSAELARIPAESVLGLGSGNPVRHAELRPGETVVDLGSGSGIDVFLASSLVGPGGRLVISGVVEEGDLGAIEDDCGCVGSAMVRSDYLETIRATGFVDVRIVEDRPWRSGPMGIDASAVTLTARKPDREVST